MFVFAVCCTSNAFHLHNSISCSEQVSVCVCARVCVCVCVWVDANTSLVVGMRGYQCWWVTNNSFSALTSMVHRKIHLGLTNVSSEVAANHGKNIWPSNHDSRSRATFFSQMTLLRSADFRAVKDKLKTKVVSWAQVWRKVEGIAGKVQRIR